MAEQVTEPDSTAVRVALWRAMHVQVDAPPHVLDDEIGLRLAARRRLARRPDMDPGHQPVPGSDRGARALLEDLVVERPGAASTST